MIPFRKSQFKTPKRKLIALVTNSTWNIYNFRLDLIRALHAQGFNIIVVAPVDEYIHYLNELGFIEHVPLKKLKPHGKNPYQDIQLIVELYRIFSKFRPDLILHYTIKPNIFGNFAASLVGIPTISTLTGLGYTFLNRNWINRIVARLYKWALRHPQNVVFHNSDDLQYFEQLGLVASGKTRVVPGSGVNTKRFSPMSRPSSDRFIFLFVGRILYDKGLIETVEAIRQVKKWAERAECWVVGELSPKNPMAIPKEDILSWQKEGVIKYFGRRKDVRSLIKRANVVVLPSYREGLPRAILEAMAMAKPILTTDVPGCRETVIHGKNGFLVQANSVKPLVNHMLHLYQAEEEYLQFLGENSRKIVCQHFSTDQVNQRYIEMVMNITYLRRKDNRQFSESPRVSVLDMQYAEK